MTLARDLANKANDKSIVQVVTASTTTSATSSSTSYADTNLTASITPTSASNKILVIVNQSGMYKSSGNALTAMDIKLLRGSTDLITFVTESPYSGTSLELVISSGSTVYLDSPATTSSTTYKTQFKSRVSGQNVTVQSSSAGSTICLMEVVG